MSSGETINDACPDVQRLTPRGWVPMSVISDLRAIVAAHEDGVRASEDGNSAHGLLCLGMAAAMSDRLLEDLDPEKPEGGEHGD